MAPPPSTINLQPRARAWPLTRLRPRPRQRALLLAIVVLVVAATGLARHGAAGAQDGPRVRVDLERAQVAPEETFEAFVYAENIQDLGGFQFRLAFDETYVSFITVSLGSFLGSGGRSVVVFPPQIQTGRIDYGAVSIPDTGSAANGAGDLAIVTFKALAAGTTRLDLRDVRLLDSAGAATELDGQGASLTIGALATPTPTAPPPTPTPSPAYLPLLLRRDRL